jgi:hypothetical protein
MGSSLNQAQMNALNAQNKSGWVYDDSPVVLRIKHIGSGSVTSVTCTPGTDLVLISSEAGVATTLTCTFGTDSATVGALADKINGSPYWECKVLDALRSHGTANNFVSTNITVDASGNYNLLADTTGIDAYIFRCTVDRQIGGKQMGGHRVKLNEIKYNVNLTTGAANGVRVYEYDPVKGTETQIYGRLSVQSTETTINWASGNATLDGKFGNDLIVYVSGGAFSDANGSFMDVSYQVE